MKNAPDVKWPTAPAHVGAFGPLYNRHDDGGAMSPEAVLTPSADSPPAQEEVPGEQQQEHLEGDDRGSE